MPPLPNPDASALVDRQFLDMRHKLLVLAADFDRIQRAPKGDAVLADDPRIAALREAAGLLLSAEPDRAKAMQLALSDTSEVPA